MTVLGLADDQPDPRLFANRLTGLTARRAAPGPGETGELTLALRDGRLRDACPRGPARSSREVVVRTEQAGVFDDDVVVTLPEELHTGSPREAFCPDSTATSRPPG